jgi:predicted AAA+ superfamily ATPase
VYFFEPALAIALLKTDSKDILKTTKTFITSKRSNRDDAGFFFEAQVIKQLRIFCSLINANLYYYRNKSGLEVDCIIRYGTNMSVFEIKIGSTKGIDDGIKEINNFRKILTERQQNDLISCNIVTASNMSYYDSVNDINIVSINDLFIDENDIL